MYAKTIIYFQKYYEKNAKKIIIYERKKYSGENKARKIRKYEPKPVKAEGELKQMSLGASSNTLLLGARLQGGGGGQDSGPLMRRAFGA